jgi:hypothetical protein
MMNWFSHSDKAELLLLSWAYQHPYLYTFIQIMNPTLYIVIIVAGFKVMGLIRGGSRWQRR